IEVVFVIIVVATTTDHSKPIALIPSVKTIVIRKVPTKTVLFGIRLEVRQVLRREILILHFMTLVLHTGQKADIVFSEGIVIGCCKIGLIIEDIIHPFAKRTKTVRRIRISRTWVRGGWVKNSGSRPSIERDSFLNSIIQIQTSTKRKAFNGF